MVGLLWVLVNEKGGWTFLDSVGFSVHRCLWWQIESKGGS
jgi:hypothetical protein